MGASARPDVAPGPHRELVTALHELHHHAGWPSLRRMASDAGCSHTTVAHAFSSPALPAWGTLEMLVEALGGDTGYFHDLWIAATTPADTQGRAVPRIAGRRVELAAVRRHLDGGNGLLLVVAEAGMGKTALVTTAAGQAANFVAIGHCLPLSTEVPLLPVTDVLRALLEVEQGQWFKEALADCPSYVADSLSIVLPELQVGAGFSGDDPFGRNRMFTAIGSLLDALATSRPLGLLFDDLHWADPTTRDLLEHLLARGVSVPVVGTWRTEDDTTAETAHAWLDRVRRLPAVQELALPFLTLEESVEQLTLSGTGLTGDQAERIHARSQGRPLFTEQLAAHLEDDLLPRPLLDLLGRRLADLAGDDWRVVRLLAVAARPLASTQVGRAAGLDGDRLTEVLRELQARRLVRRVADDEVELQHPLLAEVALGRLVSGEAQGVHRALAVVLAADPDVPAVEVADHWQGAVDRERELGWRITAARALGARYDWAREADNWLRALELWPADVPTAGEPPLTRAAAYLAGIDALHESLQWARAAAMSDAAEEILGEVPDEADRADLLRRAAEYRGEREGVEVGLALNERAIEIYRRLPPRIGYVHALNVNWIWLRAAGRYAEAKEAARSALQVAVLVGDRHRHRHQLGSLAWQEGIDGDLAAAVSLLDEGTALFPDGSDPIGDVGRAVIITDLLLICGGPLSETERVARTGLEIADAWGMDTEAAMMVAGNLATARLRAGQVARAAEAVPLGPDDPPDPDHWPWFEARVAIDVAEGRLGSAAAILDFLEREVGPDDEFDPERLCTIADVDFWAGTPDASLPRLLRDLDRTADSVPVRILYPVLLAAARAAAEAAGLPGVERAAAAAHLRDLYARLNRRRVLVDSLVLAHAAAIEAELARLRGGDGPTPWATAATAWDKVGRPHDSAYCRWRASQAALRAGQGTLAIRLLTRAAGDAREHVPLSEAVGRSRASGPD